MSEPADNRPFPRGALMAAGCLVSASLVAATLARTYDIGATRFTPGPILESRDLVFSDTADGSVRVEDAKDGQLVDILAPGSSGFVRVVLHGLARERGLAGIGPEVPFHLRKFTDGTTVIEDSATGRTVNVGAFGPDNSEAFAPLLVKGR